MPTRLHWHPARADAIGVTLDERCFSPRRNAMAKSQDAKKAVKKEPLKTMKEKKAAKKEKKEEKLRKG
ncbi:MAG: hypothetical protein WBV56_05050 [Azonexus sp.]